MSFKREEAFVKENYMLSCERITVYYSSSIMTTIVSKSYQNLYLRSKYQSSDSGSYRLEYMLRIINNLPNHYNPFTQKGYTNYALDDYAAHLMPELREANWKRFYIFVILGGFLQQNDMHIHLPLKRNYRDAEARLMISKLQTGRSTMLLLLGYESRFQVTVHKKCI